MAKNTLEIVIKADSSKAAAEIKKLEANFGKIGVAVDKFKGQFKSFVDIKAFTDMAGTVIDRVFDIGKAIKGLADDFMNYAFQVEDFGRIIGATPEEASKLIQVADDVRLSVESMTMAMRSAITKGYVPTIAELGKMSDRYLSIQDPIARSKFLIDTFGRSGLEMAKLMELGSTKIGEMGNSIEGTARLMTTEGIKAATDYYNALDELGDATYSLKLAAGQELIPALAGLTKELASVLNYANMAAGAMDGFGAALAGNKTEIAKFVTIMLAQNIGYDNAYKLLQLFTKEEYDNADATDEARLAQVEAYRTSLTAAYGIDILGSAYTNTANSIDAVSTATDKSVSDLARMAQKIEGIPKSVQVKMDFQLPDITSKLSDWVTTKKWEEAGGQVVNKFLTGMTAAMQGLDASELGAVSSKLSALELAIKVKIGEISPAEAAQQLQAAFPDLKGGAPMAEIKAALAVDVNASDTAIQDYLKSALTEPVEYSVKPTVSDIGKTELKDAINAIADATIPVKPVVKSEGLRADLISQITTAAGGEIPVDLLPKIKEMSTAELAALKSQIVPQPFDVKITPSLEQTDLDTLFKAIDATIPRDATTEWGKMQEKIDATGKSVQMYQGDLSTWSDTTYGIGERAREAASQVGALNTQLKSIPKNIDVKINITSSGGKDVQTVGAAGGARRRAGGGTVEPNQWYMVGENGPELFIPNTIGRIVPNSQITNNNTDKNIYITNNYTITPANNINVRELARQVAREQQRAGVT